MHTSDTKAHQLPTRDYWVFILRNLITFWNIWVKIILTVKLGKVGNLASNCKTHLNHIFYCFFIDNRKRSRMRHAYRANVGVWFLFVWVIFATTKHLRVCL